jgi:hypothetical protein
MNAHPSICVQDAACEPERLVLQLQAASGRFIEKCAEAERYVLVLLNAGDSPKPVQPRAPLSCKIAALRATAEGRPGSPRQKKLLKLLDELAPLAELRTELAHSTMSAGLLGSEPTIFLGNAANCHKWIDQRVAITAEGMKEAHRALSGLVNQLRQQSTP